MKSIISNFDPFSTHSANNLKQWPLPPLPPGTPQRNFDRSNQQPLPHFLCKFHANPPIRRIVVDFDSEKFVGKFAADGNAGRLRWMVAPSDDIAGGGSGRGGGATHFESNETREAADIGAFRTRRSKDGAGVR